jgi:hypothetical protein
MPKLLDAIVSFARWLTRHLGDDDIIHIRVLDTMNRVIVGSGGTKPTWSRILEHNGLTDAFCYAFETAPWMEIGRGSPPGGEGTSPLHNLTLCLTHLV